ncbi:ImmA/IrrE family metallo-endopeptidase, partial [Klebsiella pneumoniae]|uniref:ImmA/IrrE family metallo-endopeptidase n=1 Tax=Klebsiella pneumoniae TaxID=573 RepID=UPI003854442E
RHDVRVRIVPDDVEDTAMRRFDAASGTLFLSSQLSASSRNFHLANQIALLSERDTIEDLVAEAKLTSDDARAICRVGLANYFAGALILPYR